MDFIKVGILGVCAACAAICGAVGARAQSPPPTLRCEAVVSGIEYRAFLPDQKRYIYVAVKVLPGFHPSVFVMIDKNYDAKISKVASADPLNVWWLDRSKPMFFSTDKVKVRWTDRSAWSAVTSWMVTPNSTDAVQAIRGIDPDGARFSGLGSTDSNSYAFQTRIELPGFSGDSFEVTVPSVSFDGVTLTPPVVKFERGDGNNFDVKC
jgi:hypothetical protein